MAEVRALLNKRLRVKVVDGRVFEGYLRCFDKKPTRKCVRKQIKGKCYKVKVATKRCRKTCGTC